jgi:hypothetical protein
MSHIWQHLYLIFSSVASVFSTLSLENRKQAWNNHGAWFCMWMCVSMSYSVHLLSCEWIKHGCKTINGYPLPQFPTVLSNKILNVWTWAEVGSLCNVGSWNRILLLSFLPCSLRRCSYVIHAALEVWVRYLVRVGRHKSHLHGILCVLQKELQF